jgi:hypothetical protein
MNYNWRTTMKNFWILIVTLILFTLCVTAMCEMSYAVRENRSLRAEVRQQATTIDFLDTVRRHQLDDIELWDERVRVDCKVIVKLNDDIRGYKSLNEALEGRIQKREGLFYKREENLRDEIVRLREQLRSGIMPPLEVDGNEDWDALEPTCQ